MTSLLKTFNHCCGSVSDTSTFKDDVPRIDLTKEGDGKVKESQSMLMGVLGGVAVVVVVILILLAFKYW